MTNVVLDSPPVKRDPTAEEIAFYAPFVDRIVDIIQPAVIATLGGFAMNYIFTRLNLPEKRARSGMCMAGWSRRRCPTAKFTFCRCIIRRSSSTAPARKKRCARISRS